MPAGLRDRVFAMARVGECDVAIILEIADLLATRIPGATKQVFPDTAHMLNMERPAEFNQSVLDFLSAHPIKATSSRTRG